MLAGIKSSVSETSRTNKDCHQTGRSVPEDALKIMSCFGQLWPNVDDGGHENSHCELPGHLLVRECGRPHRSLLSSSQITRDKSHCMADTQS